MLQTTISGHLKIPVDLSTGHNGHPFNGIDSWHAQKCEKESNDQTTGEELPPSRQGGTASRSSNKNTEHKEPSGRAVHASTCCSAVFSL